MKKIKSDMIKSYIGYIIIGILFVILVFYIKDKYDIGFYIPSSWSEPEIVSSIKAVMSKRAFWPTVFAASILIISLIYSTIKVRKVLNQINRFEKETQKSLDNLEINEYEYKYVELTRINNIMNESIIKIKQNQLLEKHLMNSTMHDIRTPLHIMNAYNDMLMMESETTEYTEKIKKKIEDLNNIIESSLQREGKSSFQINNTLEELINGYKESYKDINFQMNLDSKNLKIGNISEVDFKRIITNIIDNGIKALDGKSNIYITTKDNVIEIENEGLSISNEEFMNFVNDVSDMKKRLGTKIIYKLCNDNNIKVIYMKSEKGTRVKLEMNN